MDLKSNLKNNVSISHWQSAISLWGCIFSRIISERVHLHTHTALFHGHAAATCLNSSNESCVTNNEWWSWLHFCVRLFTFLLQFSSETPRLVLAQGLFWWLKNNSHPLGIKVRTRINREETVIRLGSGAEINLKIMRQHPVDINC